MPVGRRMVRTWQIPGDVERKCAAAIAAALDDGGALQEGRDDAYSVALQVAVAQGDVHKTVYPTP